MCECGETVEKQFLALHKQEECPNRTITCRFCAYQCQATFMPEHEEPCGDRTELCTKCNLYVKRRGTQLTCAQPAEKVVHDSFKCGVTPEENFTCPFCLVEGLGEEDFILHVK